MLVDSAGADYRAVGVLLDQLVSSGLLAGANVLIHRSGSEAFYHQVGLSDVATGRPVARDTIFRLFSMTKPVVAAAAMCLVDDGILGLDDALTDYIPEFAGLGVFLARDGDMVRSAPAGPICIRHLLTHTAGFSYWFHQDNPVASLYADDSGIGLNERWRFDPALGGLEGLVRSLARLPLVARPGNSWHYGMSFEVAGSVIERATGLTLETFLKARIFTPLAMADTAFSIGAGQADRLASLYGPKAGGGLELLESGHDSPLLKTVSGHAGGGGLVATIEDYARFAEMLRNGGELDGQRVLSAEAVRAMMSNQLAPEQLAELPELAVWGLGGTGDGLGFGLGGAVVLDPPANGIPVFRGEYSWGGGASTTFWIDPENELTVVFMTQLFPPSAEMLRDRLHSAVYEALGLAGSPSF